MKRTIFFLAVLFCAASVCSAQADPFNVVSEQGEASDQTSMSISQPQKVAYSEDQAQLPFRRNEFSIGYGFVTDEALLNTFGSIIALMFVPFADYTNYNFSGAGSFSYIYRITPFWGVGGVFAYEHVDATIQDTRTKENVGHSKNDYLSLMPTVKGNWYNSRNVNLYSKLSAGLTWVTRLDKYIPGYVKTDSGSTTDSSSNTSSQQSDDQFKFGYQIGLIGIEVGRSFCGYAELGFGRQGLIQAGVKYRF